MELPKYLTAIFAATFVLAVIGVSGASNDDVPHFGPPSASSNITKGAVDIIRKYNYPVEIHTVTTEDGYIITMHRIPSKSGTGKPVLMHHGMLCCSADWVVLGPGRALGFMLADQGFDVWMTNARGSTYSKAHTKLSTSSRAFWDFSWHEVGYYDIPAEIDYILQKTGHKQLSFVAHSMGTTAFFVMGAMRPEVLPKVDTMVGLGPVAYFEHCRGLLLKSLGLLGPNMQWVIKNLGPKEFMPTNSFLTWAGKKFCRDDSWSQTLCKNVLFILYGYDSTRMNGSLAETIFEYEPAGAATKELLHFGQLVRSAPNFRRYDYGALQNFVRYGQFSPPDYNLSHISIPVHLFMSANDWFSGEKDVLRLAKGLPNAQTVKLIDRGTYNHMDFVFAGDSRELVYDDVMRILESGGSY